MSLFVEGKFFKEAGANGGGGGGSDPHNLGYYTDLTALQTAHPIGSNGDFAILGSTDTIWVWDSGTSAWKDTDQKGQVESVNGRTGAVTVSEVPSQTGYSGRVLGTDGFVAGWIEPERVQRDAMPVANEDEANNIYEYVGTTDANYTNGYFYKCAGTTTPSSATAAQTVGSTLSDIAVDIDTLEAFTGWTTDNSLQIFYTADGWSVDTTSLGVTYTGTPNVGDAITITYTAAVTTYAWERIDVQPTPSGLPDQTGQSGKFLTTDGTDASWGTINALQNTATGSNSLSVGSATTTNFTISFGQGINTSKNFATSFGYGTRVDGTNGLAIGYDSEAKGNLSTAIGSQMKANAVNAIQIGAIANGTTATNSDANTFKVANANGNYEIMSADGTIPEARLADTTNAQQGDVLTLDANGDAVWQASSGGSYLPLTGGTLTGALEVKDSNASSIKITNSGQVQFLYNGVAKCGITRMAGSTNDNEILFDSYTGTECTLGRYNNKLKDIYTKNITTQKINNGADINVPTTGGTMAVIGVNTTATLAVADWSSNTQTVTVSGVKADSVVFVSPAPASASDYASAGILCTAQAADSLTFTCTTTPSNAITVNVVCM